MITNWHDALRLINEYAMHVTDATNHEAASRSDLAQSAALKTLAKLRELWEQPAALGGVPNGWKLVQEWKLRRAAEILDRDGDEYGIAADLRAMLSAAPAPEVGGVPAAWQGCRWNADPDELGWGDWQNLEPQDCEWWRKRATVEPERFKVRPLFLSAAPAQDAPSAQDARDAARYRWLRNANWDFESPIYNILMECPSKTYSPMLDAAIDAAMQGGESEGEAAR